MSYYTPYGLYRFDSLLQASPVSSMEVNVNDNSPSSTIPFDIVHIVGGIKTSIDETTPVVVFKDNNDSAIGAHYRASRSNSTATSGAASTTVNTEINLTTSYNVGNYFATPGSSSNVEMYHFHMTLKYNRNSSAPISRVNGWWQSSYETYTGSPQMSYGCFLLYEDVNPFTASFSFSDSATILGEINVWGLCGDSVD